MRRAPGSWSPEGWREPRRSCGEAPASRSQDLAVRDFAHKPVTEIVGFGAVDAKQPARAQVLEHARGVAFRRGLDLAQEIQPDGKPQHGHGLEEPLFLVLQRVDPRRDYTL